MEAPEQIESHGYRYFREDLVERKKSALQQGLLEEGEYYPTLLKGHKQSFEGKVIKFTADETDLLAEQFFNGSRDRLRSWLEKTDKEYLTKSYVEQLEYKMTITNRLVRAQRSFK